MTRIPIASFLQPTRGWSEKRWDEEFKLMKEAGFKIIILQSVVDLIYSSEDAETVKALGEDYTKYNLVKVKTLYPSQIELLKNSKKCPDTLLNCFKAAKNNDMKVMIGPLGDTRWWLYGWKIPKTPEGETDIVNKSYFGRWVKQDAALSNQIASEIWDRYGAKYGDQLFGWYYWNEIWNMPLACEEKDNGVLTKIIANNFNPMLEHYSKITPEKPFLFSPFCNFDISSASGYEKMCKDLIKNINFRPGDIFCPQDSIGCHPHRLPELEQWTKGYKAAVETKPGLRLWSNNEDFSAGAKTSLLDRYVKQLEITSKYCEENIVFAWNHYLNPLRNVNPGFNKAYLEYIKNGKLDNTPPNNPVLSFYKSGSRYTITIDNVSYTDNIAQYKLFSSDGKEIGALFSTKSGIRNQFKVKSKGIYSVKSYSFTGIESQKTDINIQ